MSDRDTRHKASMEKLKARVEEKVASANEQRGLIIVNTGNGKGKTTAAWGTVTRALGYGYKVGVVQFITYMLKFGYLEIESVKQALENRPQEQTVIITGRNAHRELVAMADTVTEMQEVRHAFNNGLQARRGIDF